MKKLYSIFIFSIVASLIISSCTKKEKIFNQQASTTISLRWVKAYDNETKEKVETGIKWALLFLGASLNKGSFDSAAYWHSENKMLDLDFSKLGFSEQSLEAIKKLLIALKMSGEYTERGGIDIGRFITLTINSSNHYYAITNAPKTISEFKNRLIFDTKKAVVVESFIAKGQREIEMPAPHSEEILKHGFSSSEGSGLITDGSFKSTEFEVFDLMQNGMFRFMLYDELGMLKPAGDTSLGGAGKPANCLWCHEISIQPAFISKTKVNGYYSPEEYEEIIKKQLLLLQNYRSSLNQDIDYNKTQEHTLTELLYISFTEPSAERIAKEWNASEEQVKEKLKGLPTHTHDEFPFLGTLYHRKDVDKLSPYNVIRVPESAREHSEYEPDLIK